MRRRRWTAPRCVAAVAGSTSTSPMGTRTSGSASARYGVVLPLLAREVQERVAEALTAMCGVEVDGIDVSVEAVE